MIGRRTSVINVLIIWGLHPQTPVDSWFCINEKMFIQNHEFSFISLHVTCYNNCRKRARLEDLLLKAPDNARAIHFFVDFLEFPVAVYICTDWESTQLDYFTSDYNPMEQTSFNVIQWCVRHHIQYDILYPVRKSSIIKKPRKYIRFLQLKKRVKQIQ